MLSRKAAIAALSVAVAPVFAADTPTTRKEPLVVTVTRFEDRHADKPVNLSVITADDISASTAKTVPDLLAEQAGIAVHDLFGNNAASTTVDLRGFGVTGTQNTLVLVDGRRLADIDLSGVQWSALPLSAIERIEIVRGGGSVLYGEGATAGVINIITRAPGAPELTLRGSAGSYDTREGAVHGSIGRSGVGINLFGSHLESSGYRDNNRNRQSNALADLRWSGTPGDFSVKLGADDQGIRLPGARQVQPSAGVNQLETARRGAQTPLDWAQREGNRALFDWRRDAPFGELNVSAGWREKAQRSYFDFGGFPDYRDVDLAVRSLTPRLKVTVPVFGRPNTLVVGLDWYSWDYQRRTSNSPANVGQPVNSIDAKQDTIGIYALDTIRLTDFLSVSAGARRERLKVDATDRFDPTAPGASPFGSAAADGAQRRYEHAYELGARYELAPATAVTAKTARSYRFANVDEIYEFSPFFTNQFQFLEPQTARSHELGVEARRARAGGRATAFVIDVQNEIHLDPFSVGVGNRNLPLSRRRGIELELNAKPWTALRLLAAYTYIDARFREGTLTGSPFGSSIAGKTVPLVPRHKVNLSASWDVTSATRLSAMASYVGEQFMENDEPNSLGVRIPSYAVFDLKLTHRRGPWLIAATLNNVFDEKYYNYAVRSQFVADRYNAYPLPERNGVLSVEYRFR
jgi:iron complex outermembrane receptor protein